MPYSPLLVASSTDSFEDERRREVVGLERGKEEEEEEQRDITDAPHNVCSFRADAHAETSSR